MAIYKLCSWHGCTKILKQGDKYCNYHMKRYRKQEHERYREYDLRRKKEENKVAAKHFYDSKEFQRVKGPVIADCFGMDILEFYRTGRIVVADRVHHIITLEEDWNSRFDVNNLICLTEKNHRIVHVEYDKGKKERETMQKILFNLLNKFSEEYLKK
ncbi:hypothetical protein [Clostridium butyricum]|uniref:Gp50 protein n=1 Tax=Clostridium butyricum E4 str. BoNT E BL5262 TaxID=632245 RepID=C4IGS7_CLOBU|nr:hypothetical protein [Clostridium butyricum]EDT74819.1 Gp50 protein [Clostridium butyricum 5521]EEP54768.1 Gp50 protein [Clostridium butyricum E4 str. BoNT E BL5262]NFL30495.1 hypothetical protein [Clostridium butyricum]NFS19450.1 hypothetical protein [Clostridium butyricum]